MTEEALVRQLKEGDKTSFDLLYEKYKNMALHTAYLITGDFSGSEDVVQDTFVKVWLHCRELNNDSGFKAWMMQILVRTAYKSGKKKNRELPDEEIMQKADRGQCFSSMEQVIAREEAKAIAEAVSALQEYQVREIAAILGVMEGTVKSRLHTARKLLRGSLSDVSGMTVEGLV